MTLRAASGQRPPGPAAIRLAETVSDAGTTLFGCPRRVKGKGRRGIGTARASLGGVLAAAALLAGCASGPTVQPAGTAAPGPVTQEAPGLQVSVDSRAWQGRPRNLTDRILPFLIQLRNSGTTPLTFIRTDFFLLDETNRQYLPLNPADVVSVLGGQPSSTVVNPSVGVASGGGGTAFGLGLGVYLGGPYGGDSDTRDIIPQALQEGPLFPGAETRGFLYFPIPAPGYRTLRLVVLPRDIPGQLRLEFEFQPIPK